MYGEQIKDLQTQINEKLDQVQKLQDLVTSESRGFSDDERTGRETSINEIKALQARKADLEESEKLVSAKAVPAAPVAKQVTAHVATGGVAVADSDPSLFFAKQAHALFMTGNNRFAAAQYAKEVMGSDLLAKTFQMPADIVAKATIVPGDSTTAGWAAELVTVNQANSAFIDLLRDASVVARFPGRQMSFAGNGSIKIPRQTGGVTGQWIGENKAIPLGALSFDDITLTPKKNAVIVASTNELLRRSDPSAMMLIRDDLIEGIANAIDTAFVDATAASATRPAGIQTFDSSPTASAGATLDLITADLKAMISQQDALNLPVDGRVWMMSPANRLTLQLIRDGLGTYAFRDEINSGVLLGYPLLVSNVMTDAIVMLANSSNIIIATELAPEISISQDASLHMETAPADDIGGATTPVQSMFQTDSTAIRALTTLDWVARRPDVVSVTNTVTWAA